MVSKKKDNETTENNDDNKFGKIMNMFSKNATSEPLTRREKKGSSHSTHHRRSRSKNKLKSSRQKHLTKIGLLHGRYQCVNDFLNRFDIRGFAYLLLFADLFCTLIHSSSKKYVDPSGVYREYADDIELLIGFHLHYLEPFPLAILVALVGDNGVKRRHIFIAAIVFLLYSSSACMAMDFVQNRNVQRLLMLSAHYANDLYDVSVGVKDSIILDQVDLHSDPSDRARLRTFILLFLIFKEIGRTDYVNVLDHLTSKQISVVFGLSTVLLGCYVFLLTFYRDRIFSPMLTIGMIGKTIVCICTALKRCLKNENPKKHYGWLGHAWPDVSDYVIKSTRRSILLFISVTSFLPFVFGYIFVINLSDEQRDVITHYYESEFWEHTLTYVYASYILYYILSELIFFPILKVFTPVQTHMAHMILSLGFLFIAVTTASILDVDLRKSLKLFPIKDKAHIVIYNSVSTEIIVTFNEKYSLRVPAYDRAEIRKVENTGVRKTIYVKTEFRKKGFSLDLNFSPKKAVAVVFKPTGFLEFGNEPLGEELNLNDPPICVVYVVSILPHKFITVSQIQGDSEHIQLTRLPIRPLPRETLVLHRLYPGNHSMGFQRSIFQDVQQEILVYRKLLNGGVYAFFVLMDDLHFIRGRTFLVYNGLKFHVSYVYSQLIILLIGLAIMELSLYTFLTLETPVDLKSSFFTFFHILRGPLRENLTETALSAPKAKTVVIYYIGIMILILYSLCGIQFVKKRIKYNFPNYA